MSTQTSSEPTPEQLHAIVAYAKENGRNWKANLRADWMRAAARIDGRPSGLLQQVRNQFGPSWLNTFQLPKEP